MIRSIEACAHMVKITSDENGEQLISRRDALLRAQAIIGLDGDAPDMTAQLIKAANQARINDPSVGRPYSSTELDAFLKAIQLEGQHA